MRIGPTSDLGSTNPQAGGHGASVGWRALTGLALTLSTAEHEASAGATVFVFACSDPGRQISWHIKVGEFDSETWPAGPEPIPQPPTPRPAFRPWPQSPAGEQEATETHDR